MREYREPDADNGRWEGFEFRPGDVIVDAPSKSGTTWTQLLAALLIFDGPDFPEPIGRMSLWMEQRTRPVTEAHATFAAQTRISDIRLSNLRATDAEALAVTCP